MKLRIAATIGLVSLTMIGGGALANQIQTGPTRAHPASPGPCGYGRVQKTVCEVVQHRPAQPQKICKKICVAI